MTGLQYVLWRVVIVSLQSSSNCLPCTTKSNYSFAYCLSYKPFYTVLTIPSQLHRLHCHHTILLIMAHSVGNCTVLAGSDVWQQRNVLQGCQYLIGACMHASRLVPRILVAHGTKVWWNLHSILIPDLCRWCMTHAQWISLCTIVWSRLYFMSTQSVQIFTC